MRGLRGLELVYNFHMHTKNENLACNIELVSANPDNLDIYKEIRLRGLRDEPQAFGSTLAREEAFTTERWLERVRRPYNVIAMEANKPVGTMGAYVSEDEPTIANIIGVFVASEARGKGVGAKLLNEVLSRIKQNVNIKTVALTVNKEQLPAVSLYEKFGFEITGEEKNLMGDGQEHEEYRMVLAL